MTYGNGELPNGGWVPVSEKLPKCKTFYNTHGVSNSSDYVLVTVVGEHNNFRECLVTVGRYNNDRWTLLYGNKYGKIVAWMPLPQPYKAESEEI